ncbi:MAG: response regulator, partial [Campylobacterota bacterium]|nr:response regulator [Campylobacterota bacterium]
MNRYKTILAVDDTPSNLDILVDILDRYEVFASTDGYDALKILKDKNIDLILLDIVMPSLNGFDLCKMLKEEPKTKDIPVIFITSKSDEETIEQAYDLGGIDYVTKPFKVKELISRVNTHLSLSNQNKELADKVEEETSKRLEQQNILVRNSRLAAMGEMMSAITHQWKQPLNAISVNVTSMEFYFKLDEVDKDEMLNHIKQINSSISFMNETVDDFKNYFNKNKTRSVFNIRKEVNRIYNMIKPQLLKENIEFIMDIDDDIKG